MTAISGKIGGWHLSRTGLWYSSASPDSTAVTLIPGGTTAATTSIGGSSGSKSWIFTAKNVFGVDNSGNMYCNGGKIGGFLIDSNSLSAGGSYGTSGSVLVCTGTVGKASIAGSGSIDGWAFTAGTNFGVTKTGALYCNSATISGTLTAGNGSVIGDLTIANGKLTVPSANISGTLTAS